MTIEDNVSLVRERIACCAERAGRRASEIRLVGVTKTGQVSPPCGSATNQL